jgi:hypothetical protein
MHRGTHRAPSKGRSRYLVVLLVIGMVAALALPALAIDGQAGKSNVYQCSLVAGEAWDTAGPGSWGNVTLKLMDDGSYWYNVTVHGLMPGTGYELRSGGPFTPAADVVANGGGNALFKGSVDDIGAYFNVWREPATGANNYRILRTNPDCIP